MNSFIQSVCCFSTCICEDIRIPAAFRQLLPQLDPHGHVYFYNYYGSLNRVCICSRECLPAPLVYVLGNTIWPQVLSVYLKPSVSVPILIVSRVSSRLASPLIIRAMWRRRCLERSGRETWRGTASDRGRERMSKRESNMEKKKTEGMNG